MDMNAPPTAPPPPLPPRPPAPPHRPRRRIHRDRANRILGGVAAGVAEAFDLDVLLVRIAWVVAAGFGIGVPAYIIAWIAFPAADGPVERSGRPRDTRMLLGLALVGIGVVVASNHILPHGFRFDRFGAPVLLIGGGVAILLGRRHRDDVDDDPPASEPPSPEPRPGREPTPTPPAAYDVSSDPPPETTVTTTEAPTQPFVDTEVVPPSAWTQTAPWPAPPSARALRRASRRDRREQRRPSFLTPLTLSILLIGAGIASLLQATGALDVNLTVVLAIGTCVVGAALVVAAFAGRAHTLILVGVLLLGATALSNTIDVPLRGGIGDHEYRPVQLSELQSHYEMGIGQLKLDLRDLPLAGHTTDIDAQTGIGHLLVLVPSSVRVEVHAHAGAGSVRLFGRENGGWPENDERAIDGTGKGVLQLDLRVGAGQVEVRRFEPGGIETIVGDNG